MGPHWAKRATRRTARTRLAQKSPMPFDIGLQARKLECLRLAGSRERPGGLRTQGGLGRRCLGSGRCLRSGFLRGFLCSRLLCCFLRGCFFRSRLFRSGFFGYLFCGWLFGSSFLGWGLFGRNLLCCYFFRRGLFGNSFFGRGFFGRYFFCWCFLGCHFFGGSFFGRYFFSRRLLRCSFFCCWFFRSCHSFLLDHIAKSTSRLEYAKRFTALGLWIPGPAPRTQEQSPSRALWRCRWSLQFGKSLFRVFSVKLCHQSQERAPPDWYSITRVSKKFRSFLRSIISLIHGNGFSSLGKRVSSPICVARRFAM